MLKRHTLIFTGLLFVLALVSPTAHGKHWVLLGSAHVDGNVDHDNIRVGSRDGRFRSIQLRVNGGAVEFERVVVHFGNGTQEELIIRDRIRSGEKTHAIDLPGERRIIESVELWYGKEHWDSRPEVSLFGSR